MPNWSKIWRFSSKLSSLGIILANCQTKPQLNQLPFFFTSCIGLDSSELGWSTLHPAGPLYRPAGSLHPTPGAASGLCQRFRFTPHSQFLIFGAACQPPFADPAANPGEKSGAHFVLVRVNVLSSGVPLREWTIDFRQTRRGLAEIKYSFLLCFLLILWNSTTAVDKVKFITYSVFIGSILKFQCTCFIAFLILFVKSKCTIIKQKTICIPGRIRNSKMTYRMQELGILVTVVQIVSIKWIYWH